MIADEIKGTGYFSTPENIKLSKPDPKTARMKVSSLRQNPGETPQRREPRSFQTPGQENILVEHRQEPIPEGS